METFMIVVRTTHLNFEPPLLASPEKNHPVFAHGNPGGSKTPSV